jgi:ATP-dependent Clp protease ATP-binding subunit ClpC
MYMPFNEAARLAMRLAELEAVHYRHDHVDTEHFLLGLLQLHDCVAARVLKKGNIDLARVRREVELAVPPGNEGPAGDRRPLTAGARKAIEFAIAATDRLGHARAGTGHLLLGLLEEAEGVAFRVLCKLGIARIGQNLSRIAEWVNKEMTGEFRS